MSGGDITNQQQGDLSRSARTFWEKNASHSNVGTPRGGPLSSLQAFDRSQPSSTANGPRSPAQTQFLAAARSGGLASDMRSPGRVRAPVSKDGGDSQFDAVKKAASRDALKDKTRARTDSQPDPSMSSLTADPRPTATLHRMASTNMASRPDLKPVNMRTSSLDSQISLSSSQSQSFRPQVEPAENVDIPALVVAAGSPEAAIKKLLQEKFTASTHNAQLWRLVEKQRTMILGLNKDLEKTLKDKDRYRKKLKDNLVSSASLATLPGTMYRASEVSDREQSQSPGPSDRRADILDSSNSTLPDRSQSSTPQQGGVRLPVSSPSSNANPMHSTPMQAPFGNLPAVRSPTHASIAANTLPNGMPAFRVPTGSPRASPTTERTPIEFVRVPSGPASPSLLDATPVASPTMTTSPKQGFSGPKEQRNAQASRKAPPAPLNLSQQARTELIVPAEPSASDYEDEAESASIGRGRRKTREDDDKDREAVHAMEEQARSRSAKSVKSKSESLHRPEHTGSPDSAYSVRSGCMSPEEPGSPHVAQVQTYHSLMSINAVLKTPQDAEFGPDIKRTLVAPSAPNLLSPGLPLSPRPIDRPMNSPMPRTLVSTIPMTPRSGLALSPRAPRHPIPMPPQTPLTISSPHLLRAETYHQQAQQNQNDSIAERVMSPGIMSPSAAEGDRLFMSNAPRPSIDKTSNYEAPRSPGDIFRGFMTEQYPGLLLPPNALPSIFVKVDSSRLRPSRHSYMVPKPSEENPVFTLAIYARSDRSQLWRVEKTLGALTALDQAVKFASSFNTKLPDKTLFAGHAPARIDARRVALALYFDQMLDTPMDEQAATIVCAFFSSDSIGTEVAEYFQPPMVSYVSLDESMPVKVKPRKDGYLTKRGKNFGGWKARYFVLDGPNLKYFEAPGGAQLGTIKLSNAQIGKQSSQTQQSDEDDDDQYRHAFLILEPKKRDSSSHVRHVLCAESDDERDAWVGCLLQYVDKPEDDKSPQDSLLPVKSPRLQKSMGEMQRPGLASKTSTQSKSSLQTVSYSDTIAAEAPIIGPRSGTPTSLSGATLAGESDDPVTRQLGNLMGDPYSWTNPPPSPAPKDKERDKEKKRSIFGFARHRASSDAVPGLSPTDPSPTGRPVFGVPLAEVAEFATPDDVPTHLPAVVYRCIEYLRAKNAISEEGIFRLSGSNIVIKALRERFNTEGDVKLLAPFEQYYDIHAIASLLKLYLRELPANVLTRDLHMEFLSCLEMEDESKGDMFNVLVNKLPRVNRELLDKLSAFLREIVDNERVNKMSVRNVGIVFSPTLNIPGPLISLFVTDHSTIFGAPIDINTTPLANRHVATGSFDSGESIRSPRKQMFSDLPTPSYTGQGFPGQQKAFTMQDAQRLRETYDTGFTPVQQTYEPIQSNIQASRTNGSGSEPNGTNGFGNGVERRQDETTQRVIKRQSGQFLMNVGMLGQQKG